MPERPNRKAWYVLVMLSVGKPHLDRSPSFVPSQRRFYTISCVTVPEMAEIDHSLICATLRPRIFNVLDGVLNPLCFRCT